MQNDVLEKRSLDIERLGPEAQHIRGAHWGGSTRMVVTRNF